LTDGDVCLQVLYGVNQRIRTEDVDSPLAAIRPVRTVTLVLITGDRGLCGGYNNFAIKKVRLARPLQSPSFVLFGFF
jgi:F-type H+-transporting ATPase subunit gamma